MALSSPRREPITAAEFEARKLAQAALAEACAAVNDDDDQWTHEELIAHADKQAALGRHHYAWKLRRQAADLIKGA